MSLNEGFECNKPSCNWFENCKKYGCGTPSKREDEYIPTHPEACNKLCPQGWAWLIGDCDFGQNCGECKEPESSYYSEGRQTK